jgi:SpoIVB peptidase S55
MYLRLAALFSFVAVLFLGSVQGSAPQMPLSEVRAGMVGKGVTVFEGNKREEFKVNILGVLENVIGPRRSLILARLEGGRLAETGVMQGMSGSPVFVDGRLIGAVSYSLGAFSKEPIAGITPIAEMTDATAMPAARPATARAASFNFSKWPPTNEDYVAALREAFSRLGPEGFRTGAGNGASRGGIELGGFGGFPTGAVLRPIATPLTMAGYSGETKSVLTSVLTDIGFVPTTGPTTAAAGAAEAKNQPAAAAPAATAALAPGDAVGVSLVRGDLALGATGTVTHVDGNRVYAFGHPFFNLGPTEFPMTKAYVHALLPSLFTSSKLASIGDIVGTIQQDRATAIAGTLGRGPDLVPVKLTLAPERGAARSFNFEVAKDQMFTPLLTFASIVNTLQAYEREFGAATFSVRGQATIKGHGQVALEDIFHGDTASIGAAAYVAGPLNILLRNDLAPVQISGVDLTITSHEEPRTTTIERAWLENENPRAGTTVPLHILTRTYRGEESMRTVPVAIPPNASGTLSVVVSDGTRLQQVEQRDRQPSQAQSVDQMIRIFNRARRNNRIYVRLVSSAPGAVINGETLSALPPSVLAVIEADRDNANVRPLSSAMLGEWELPSDYAVVGQRSLTLAVRQP